MNKWDKTTYQRIKSVILKNNNLIVDFINGDSINIALRSIIPEEISSQDVTDIKNKQFEIVIHTKIKTITIPWDKLRVLSDSKFAQFMAIKAEEQALKVGRRIKKLREKKGIIAKELAKRTGLTPQTITRIEKGYTDINFKTLRKILASLGYSLKDLANQENKFERNEKSLKFLLYKLNNIGIDRYLLYNKIIPERISKSFSSFTKDVPELLLDEIAIYVSKIFGWTPDELWQENELKLISKPLQNVYFKTKSKANLNQIKAYTHYAYFIANLIIKGCKVDKKFDYPQDIDQFRILFFENYKILNFKNILDFVWNLGIFVFPLSDTGIFHGAAWNIGGKHIILLKQKDDSNARWVFDLLHELYHVFRHLEAENSSLIETDEIQLIVDNEEIEEREANSFANQMIFNGKEEELAQKCIEKSRWKLENLKRSVNQIAEQENVGKDFLANYLARRLSFQDQNWWGAAQNLQITKPKPISIALQKVKDKIDHKLLSNFEFDLIEQALKE